MIECKWREFRDNHASTMKKVEIAESHYSSDLYAASVDISFFLIIVEYFPIKGDQLYAVTYGSSQYC